MKENRQFIMAIMMMASVFSFGQSEVMEYEQLRFVFEGKFGSKKISIISSNAEVVFNSKKLKKSIEVVNNRYYVFLNDKMLLNEKIVVLVGRKHFEFIMNERTVLFFIKNGEIEFEQLKKLGQTFD
jgi:hypothetical protein